MWDFGRRLFEPFVVPKRMSVRVSLVIVPLVLNNGKIGSGHASKKEGERDNHSPLSRNYTPLVPLQSVPHSAR
jgi:hypothetical protein